MREGRLAVDPAKGVTAADLAPLAAADPRPDAYADRHDELAGLGVAVAAHTAVRGLAGRRVAIEGFDASGPAIVAGIVSRGGRVVAISTADGTATSADGFDEAAVASGWAENGPALVTQLSEAPGKPWEVFGVEADVLVAGSKPGVIDDSVAAGLTVGTVVPSGPVPVTAKGLAVLRRVGCGGRPRLHLHRRPALRRMADRRRGRSGVGRVGGHRRGAARRARP